MKWKEYRIEEIAEVQTGPFGSQLHMKDYASTGTPIITVEHLGENKVIHENLPLVTDADKARLNKYTLAEGDIVFSRVGSVDRRAYISKREDGWMFSGRLLRVRCNKNVVNPKFLSYYFGQETFKEYIRQIAVGATMPSINTTILSEVELSMPLLTTQTIIANHLSVLDDKIDLLTRQNRTLEQLVETYFRQWFVEEEVPMVKLGDVVKTTSGGTPSRDNSSYYENGIIHWIKSKELNRSFIIDSEEKITESALENSAAKILPAKTILVAMYGATVGEYAVLSIPAACNQAVCAIMPNEAYPFTFLFSVLKNAREEFLNLAEGSAQQNINQIVVKQLPIPWESEKVQRFHKQTENLFDKIEKNIFQISKLQSLRDTLLPKLMSGEIEIKA